ncbi:MAG: DUF1153 domain-containing protein, partial [Litoreibacter sp.]|nr:DUF1153 domain-containing protein [Litoreibacter sp.]
MYVKRPQGPVAVTLPDGTQLNRSDLPSPKTSRWVASRKALVVKAVEHGLITDEEACETYSLSTEELESWRNAVSEFGVCAVERRVFLAGANPAQQL